MIDHTLVWMKEINKEHNIVPELVLDVGSRENENRKGISTSPKSLFPDSEYLGIDIYAGLNVDRILSVYDLTKNFDRGCFDAVLCLHVLEHLANPWQAIANMNFVLKKGGHLYIAIPTLGFPKHEGRRAGDAKDYWRATEEAVREGLFAGYNILNLEHARSHFGRHPFIHCLGEQI